MPVSKTPARFPPPDARATVKHDGTCTAVLEVGGEAMICRRFDRKWDKRKNGFRSNPKKWFPCEPEPDKNTGHHVGWVPLSVPDDPDVEKAKFANEVYFRSAIDFQAKTMYVCIGENEWEWMAWSAHLGKTFEFVGPKINGNPYGLDQHFFIPHGLFQITEEVPIHDYDLLREWFRDRPIEGIVWHSPTSGLLKIHRGHLNLPWNTKELKPKLHL